MNHCQACRRTEHNAFLCEDCTHTLRDMLEQIPWLIEELDNRIQKLDRITQGTIGRNRRPDELNIIDFDAAETARALRAKLLHWVNHIAEHHLGRPPAAMHTVTTTDLAKWLCTNTNHIARARFAGKLYRDIKHLVGEGQQGGTLVQAINPTERHLAGPCPTITGRHRDGTHRHCGRMLFADTYDHTVTCPDCHQGIDVEQNRLRAASSRDLHTRDELLEVLTNIDEPVTPERLDTWIRARQFRTRTGKGHCAGYRHGDTIIEFRIHPDDEPVYSLERARKLRRRDHSLTSRHGRRSPV